MPLQAIASNTVNATAGEGDSKCGITKARCWRDVVACKENATTTTATAPSVAVPAALSLVRELPQGPIHRISTALEATTESPPLPAQALPEFPVKKIICVHVRSRRTYYLPGASPTSRPLVTGADLTAVIAASMSARPTDIHVQLQDAAATTVKPEDLLMNLCDVHGYIRISYTVLPCVHDDVDATCACRRCLHWQARRDVALRYGSEGVDAFDAGHPHSRFISNAVPATNTAIMPLGILFNDHCEVRFHDSSSYRRDPYRCAYLSYSTAEGLVIVPWGATDTTPSDDAAPGDASVELHEVVDASLEVDREEEAVAEGTPAEAVLDPAEAVLDPAEAVLDPAEAVLDAIHQSVGDERDSEVDIESCSEGEADEADRSPPDEPETEPATPTNPPALDHAPSSLASTPLRVSSTTADALSELELAIDQVDHQQEGEECSVDGDAETRASLDDGNPATPPLPAPEPSSKASAVVVKPAAASKLKKKSPAAASNVKKPTQQGNVKAGAVVTQRTKTRRVEDDDEKLLEEYRKRMQEVEQSQPLKQGQRHAKQLRRSREQVTPRLWMDETTVLEFTPTLEVTNDLPDELQPAARATDDNKPPHLSVLSRCTAPCHHVLREAARCGLSKLFGVLDEVYIVDRPTMGPWQTRLSLGLLLEATRKLMVLVKNKGEHLDAHTRTHIVHAYESYFGISRRLTPAWSATSHDADLAARALLVRHQVNLLLRRLLSSKHQLPHSECQRLRTFVEPIAAGLLLRKLIVMGSIRHQVRLTFFASESDALRVYLTAFASCLWRCLYEADDDRCESACIDTIVQWRGVVANAAELYGFITTERIKSLVYEPIFKAVIADSVQGVQLEQDWLGAASLTARWTLTGGLESDAEDGDVFEATPVVPTHKRVRLVETVVSDVCAEIQSWTAVFRCTHCSKEQHTVSQS